MSAHDVYGGACPLCSGKMFQRFSTDAEGEAFEGCPLCGFSFGTASGDQMTSARVWQRIFEAWHVLHVDQIRERLPAESLSCDDFDFQPTVFSYSGELDDTLKGSCFRFPGRGQVLEMMSRLYDAGELELVAHFTLNKEEADLELDHESVLSTRYVIRRRGERYLPPDAEPLYATTRFALERCLAKPTRRYEFSPGITELAVDLPLAETVCEMAQKEGLETGDDARSRAFDNRARRWRLDTGFGRIFSRREAGGTR